MTKPVSPMDKRALSVVAGQRLSGCPSHLYVRPADNQVWAPWTPSRQQTSVRTFTLSDLSRQDTYVSTRRMMSGTVSGSLDTPDRARTASDRAVRASEARSEEHTSELQSR